ncbi:hypothetical protein PILCRDRAFT_818372, partial [Piloderma croceum F 1598]
MDIPWAFVRDLVRPLMVVFDPSYNFSIPSVIKTSRGQLGLALRAIGGLSGYIQLHIVSCLAC